MVLFKGEKEKSFGYPSSFGQETPSQTQFLKYMERWNAEADRKDLEVQTGR